MRLQVDALHGKTTKLNIQADGHDECTTAVAFIEGFINGQDKAPNPYGSTPITMDSMAEALAILNQRKSCKIEFIKFIRRISGMGLKEAKEWVEAHFDRWHK